MVAKALQHAQTNHNATQRRDDAMPLAMIAKKPAMYRRAMPVGLKSV
jgi:hypothetical protein